MTVGWSELAAGVIGGVLGAALRPWVEYVWPHPRRARQVQRTVERAWADFVEWMRRDKIEEQRELRRVDEEMTERGISQSGIATEARNEVGQRHYEAFLDKHREYERKVEDAHDKVGPLERGLLYFRLRRWRHSVQLWMRGQLDLTYKPSKARTNAS